MSHVLISHSARMTWNQCHKKYYWNQVEHLVPTQWTTAMYRGSAGHLLIGKWQADKTKAEDLVMQARMADPFLANGLEEYYKKYEVDEVTYLPIPRQFNVYLGTFGGHDFTFVGEVDGVAHWQRV